MMSRLAGIGWYHALAVAMLPWVWFFRPAWAAVVVVLILVAHQGGVRSKEGEPWRSVLVVSSAFLVLVFDGGWMVAGGWLVPALAVGACIWAIPKVPVMGRPDTVDIAAGAALAGAFVMKPALMNSGGGGWIAPIILIIGFRRLVTIGLLSSAARSSAGSLRPPTRNVRGTVSFNGSVAGADGLQRTVPLDLEILAGGSIAILCDDGVERQDLVEALSGRRASIGGQFCVDGIPPRGDESLVAVVGLSEPFLFADLIENVASLGDSPLNPDQKAAVWEACSLSEVEKVLAGAPIVEDGRPLDPHHRLMVQLARVAASHYRVLVVSDPMVSVNPIRRELWKAAVVRASVGRTAVWVTPDRELAQRAETVMVLRHGTLRAL